MWPSAIKVVNCPNHRGFAFADASTAPCSPASQTIARARYGNGHAEGVARKAFFGFAVRPHQGDNVSQTVPGCTRNLFQNEPSDEEHVRCAVKG
jgi:hypothetical protein